jgi:hypothetical protein
VYKSHNLSAPRASAAPPECIWGHGLRASEYPATPASLTLDSWVPALASLTLDSWGAALVSLTLDNWVAALVTLPLDSWVAALVSLTLGSWVAASGHSVPLTLGGSALPALVLLTPLLTAC